MLEENILIKKKDKKNKNLSIIGILLVSIMLIGSVYAFFQYTRTGEEQSKLLAGEVYLHYSDAGNILHTKPNAFPETPTEARGTEQNPRTDNVINFTIDGKNTTANKDIYYEIKLMYADSVDGRTRINDSDLRFDLEETIGTPTTRVLENVSYDTINNTRIWVNTVKHGEEIEISYKLRMWISDDVIISDTDPNKTYATEQYKNLFGSVKVMVYGDFEEKKVPKPTLYKLAEKSLANYLLEDDGDARIVSGGGGYNDGNPIEDPNLKNYVWYSGKLWRIVSLNNDGSIKLVTQDNITTILWGSDLTYYSKDEQGNETKSWMYQWLNEDFLDTLYNYENVIVTDYLWNATQITATTKPSKTTMVEAAVGLLTAYEYTQSYSKLGTSSSAYRSGYLNNGYIWWLLTPDMPSWPSVWYVNRNGQATFTYPFLEARGVRPSINISSNIQISGNGDGSKSNPYTLEGDITNPLNNTTKLNERASGEYLKFDNELYRIVNIENGITKITKTDYIRDGVTAVNKYFSSTANFGSVNNETCSDGTITYNVAGTSETKNCDEHWDYYLNNTWYNSIRTSPINYKGMLVEGTWYIGEYADRSSYKNAVCATTDTIETTKQCTPTTKVYEGFVGLGRVGEPFTSQIGTGRNNSSDIWTITSYYGANVVYDDGIMSEKDIIMYLYAARPSMFLSSDVIITDGLGTEQRPFEIALPSA